MCMFVISLFFFFQAEDGIRDLTVTGVQTCALPISVILSAFAGTLAFASSRLISLTRRVFSATSCIRRSRSLDACDRLSIRACTSGRSEEHTSELQSQSNLVCRLLLEKKKKTNEIY